MIVVVSRGLACPFRGGIVPGEGDVVAIAFTVHVKGIDVNLRGGCAVARI